MLKQVFGVGKGLEDIGLDFCKKLTMYGIRNDELVLAFATLLVSTLLAIRLMRRHVVENKSR